jgi:hypothetical protein
MGVLYQLSYIGAGYYLRNESLPIIVHFPLIINHVAMLCMALVWEE